MPNAFTNVDLSAVRQVRDAKLADHRERLLQYDDHPKAHGQVGHEFDLTFPINIGGFESAATDWTKQTGAPATTFFDISQYSGYTSILFRSMLGQTNDAAEATVEIRLVSAPLTDPSDITPVEGSELSITATGVTGVSIATEIFYTGDLSLVLPDYPCLLGVEGKVSDVDNAYTVYSNLAVIVRYG